MTVKGYEERKDNPLTKKWGFSDFRATAALEGTRKDMVGGLKGAWLNLKDEQRAYFKDILDYEQLWESNQGKDWRLFFKQPRVTQSQNESGLNGWWHKPLDMLKPSPRGGELESIGDVAKEVLNGIQQGDQGGSKAFPTRLL